MPKEEEVKPALSFILCSRNDSYMGDPMWRLGTSLNFLCANLVSLDLVEKVEIIVCDWGSKDPISSVIELNDESASICQFLHIPPECAEELQGDSPFAEVFALNAAARRSTGQYIARMDQDTLVTKDFLISFFQAHHADKDFGFELARSYMFAARKQLPYSFVEKKPSLSDIERLISAYGGIIFAEELKHCYWASAVGILMAHRSIWFDAGGYDERLKYYWYMDVDLGTRLIKKYPIVNIGKKFGYDFYHLEHFPAGQSDGRAARSTHRKRNPKWAKSFDKPVLNPNGENWGLAETNFSLTRVDNAASDLYDNNAPVLDNWAWRQRLLFGIVKSHVIQWCIYSAKFGHYLYKKMKNLPPLE